MKLKNELYKIVSADAEAKSFDIELIADSIIYRAHFPEMPITPGVCIIQIAAELYGELIGSPVEIIGVSNAKYLAVISPTETRAVTYTFKKITEDPENGTTKVQGVVTKGDTIYTKFTIAVK